MPVVQYLCQYCSRVYDTEQAAVDCENSHPKIKAAVADRIYSGKYPDMVHITFEDGTTHQYISEYDLWVDGYKVK